MGEAPNGGRNSDHEPSSLNRRALERGRKRGKETDGGKEVKVRVQDTKLTVEAFKEGKDR